MRSGRCRASGTSTRRSISSPTGRPVCSSKTFARRSSTYEDNAMAEMKRARTQVLFRYTPKAMFRYNETYGWCEVTSIEMKNVEGLSPALAEAMANVLENWEAIRPDAFADPRKFPQKYEVGEPWQV